MTVQVSPQVEKKLIDAARSGGLTPGAFVDSLVDQYAVSPIPETMEDPNDRSIALLESWIAAAPTDPEAIRDAELDVAELKRNMNLPRKLGGGRLLFPETPAE